MFMTAISFDEPSKGTVTSTSRALTIVNKGAGGALQCIADNSDGYGIIGESKGNSVGVYGVSTTGTGSNGLSTSGIGVRGESKGGKAGVYGISGEGPGVYGVSTIGTGISGVAKAKTGYGVRGANEVDGNGVYGVSQTGNGVYGESKGAGAGVVAKSATGEAIHAECSSPQSAAIKVVNTVGFGIWADSKGSLTGIVGRSATGHGVWGESLGGNAGLVGKSATANGVIAESLGSGAGLYATSKDGRAGYFNGDVEVNGNVEVTKDIRLVNAADCAEEFNVVIQVEPGTVMVLDNNGSLEASSNPYDKRVAGIISGAGGYKPGIILDKQQDQEQQENNYNQSKKTRMAVALIGKVYCKVDASLSSIEIGDLLTTSSTVGHAMKADDPFKAFGAVIGKALQPIKEGKGMIPVLVALQ